MIDQYLDGGEFADYAPRTQRDIRTSILHAKTGITREFGDYPLAAFADRRIRGVALKWRDGMSPKEGDTRIRHLQQISKWGWNRGLIADFHLRDISARYKAGRSHIIWTDDEIATAVAGSPAHIARIIMVASETGLRPGDLHKLRQFHIRDGRILITTSKRQRAASIPITEAVRPYLPMTPKTDRPFLVNASGQPYADANYLGAAVARWRDKLGLRPELRLYDLRGTAVTRLLEAGAEMGEIATFMGWSVKQAHETISHYAALHPDMTARLGAKIEKLRG